MSERGTKLILGGIGLAALALAGVPEVLLEPLPPGVLSGVVVDSSGYALPGARVFLFAGDSERPRAETRTDASGAFDFAFVPPRPRVFVRAPEGSGRLDAFGPTPREARGPLAFVLPRARALEVRVRRAPGLALEGLEVRVHGVRGEGSVIALAHTDATGHAELPAPARAHVVVQDLSTGLFRWRFDVEVPAEGHALELELGAAEPLTGRVEVAGLPRAGLELALHADGPEPLWCGLTRSDATGAFTLPHPGVPCRLTVRDPEGRVLPERVQLDAETRALTLALDEGEPQVVRTLRDGRPLPARLHLWSRSEGLLGPGLRTDGQGRLELAVPPEFTLIVTPLDHDAEPIQEWDLSRSPHELVLAVPREP